MPNPNSNNAIIITSAVGEAGPQGFNGNQGPTGATGNTGAQGTTGGKSYDKIDIAFGDDRSPVIRVSKDDGSKIIGSFIYSGVLQNAQPSATELKIVMSGLYAYTQVEVIDKNNTVYALARVNVTQNMAIYNIPIIESNFPAGDELLSIRVLVTVQAGYSSSSDAFVDYAFFQLT